MSNSKILTSEEVAEIERLLAEYHACYDDSSRSLLSRRTPEGDTARQRVLDLRTQLATIENTNALCATVRHLLSENERLKRGDFTADEFQNLCHSTDIQAGFDAFADGCEAYQQKMFGRCRTKGKVL